MNYIFYIENGKISSPIIGITSGFCFKYLLMMKRFLIRLKIFKFILNPAVTVVSFQEIKLWSFFNSRRSFFHASVLFVWGVF